MKKRQFSPAFLSALEGISRLDQINDSGDAVTVEDLKKLLLDDAEIAHLLHHCFPENDHASNIESDHDAAEADKIRSVKRLNASHIEILMKDGSCICIAIPPDESGEHQ